MSPIVRRERPRIISQMLALLTTLLLSLRVPLFLLPVSVSASSPRVDTGYAIYVGNQTRTNTVAFLGIPYAEPPVGRRRFRAPEPLDIGRLPRNKTFDATKYPEFCVQGTTGSGDAGTSISVVKRNACYFSFLL